MAMLKRLIFLFICLCSASTFADDSMLASVKATLDATSPIAILGISILILLGHAVLIWGGKKIINYFYNN